jgi:uncharacterized protein YbjT (DUF2867 family)
MSQQKIIAVVGATGAQGGGLVKAILADPSGDYAVRALTRDTTSPRAQELVKLGAEVVQADNYDEESLVKAFTGAYGAFLVTNFWAHMSAEKELEEAGNLASAAKRTGLKHVIWSTLEDTRDHIPVHDTRMPTLQETYKVPHFDAKAEDIGRTAYGLLKAGPAEYSGRTVHIAGEHLTGEQIAAGLSRATGERVVYRPLTHDAYRDLGFPGADEAGNMLQYYTEFEDYFTGVRDLDEVRKLNPGLQTFDQWLDANGHTIPTA